MSGCAEAVVRVPVAGEGRTSANQLASFRLDRSSAGSNVANVQGVCPPTGEAQCEDYRAAVISPGCTALIAPESIERDAFVQGRCTP